MKINASYKRLLIPPEKISLFVNDCDLDGYNITIPNNFSFKITSLFLISKLDQFSKVCIKSQKIRVKNETKFKR